MLRALLIEDNDNDAELVGAMLEQGNDDGVEVTRARDLGEARERLERLAFDVILLDLSLPDAKGIESVEHMRQLAPGTAVVVLTGFIDPKASTQALHRGVQDVLRKGQVEPSGLLRAIAHARERQHHANGSRLLSEVSDGIALALDIHTMLRSVVEALSRSFADRCVVDGFQGAGGAGGTDVVSLGVPGSARLYASLAEVPAVGPDRGRLDQLDLRTRSALVVPFVVDGAESGALVLGRVESTEPYGPADLLLAEEIGRRAVAACAQLGARAALHDREDSAMARQLKDDFLATLSHELRTPMTAILGWTHILLEGALAPDKQALALETIARNARSQIRLIEDVLDVSLIVTGKLRLNIRSCDVDAVLKAAVDAVVLTAAVKGVRLDTPFESALEAGAGTAMVDCERLQQVLWNLVANAVKFTPRDGTVTVRVRRDEVFLEFLVTDDGQGIAADFLPHIFDRFRQADESITRTHSGLGLGLAIARHIVELHGGTIGVDSAGPGKGASFFVRMPVEPPPEPTRPFLLPGLPPGPADLPVDLPAKSLIGRRVLIIDDEPDLLDLLRLTLERHGAEVVAVMTPEEALAALHEHTIDVIVSDIGLSGATGYDLIHSVRALPAPAGRTPAIALTAYASAADRLKALNAGFNHHMSKPYEPKELVTVIETLARRAKRR